MVNENVQNNHNSWILAILLHRYTEITEKLWRYGVRGVVSGHIVLNKIRIHSGEQWRAHKGIGESSRREFLRWEDQMLQSSLKQNCKDVTYDGQPLQASVAAGLTGWAKALQCLKSSVVVPHSLNSARDGYHRAEITCASCGLNYCLHNGLFYTRAKQSLKHHWFALGGKQPTWFHI